MAPMDDRDRRMRAEARHQRVVLRRVLLGAPGPDLDPLHGPDAISMVTLLSRESWALSGRPWPEYERADTPCRFVRWPGE